MYIYIYIPLMVEILTSYFDNRTKRSKRYRHDFVCTTYIKNYVSVLICRCLIQYLVDESEEWQ